MSPTRILSILAALVLLASTTTALVHPSAAPHRTVVAAAVSAPVGTDDVTLVHRASRAHQREVLTAARRAQARALAHARAVAAERARQAALARQHAAAARRSVSSSGSIPAVWVALVGCEATGNWHYSGDFEGGPNFSHSTWVSYGGTQFAAYAYDATPWQQIIVARRVLTTGWGGNGPQGVMAWPVCGPRVGLRRGD